MAVYIGGNAGQHIEGTRIMKLTKRNKRGESAEFTIEFRGVRWWASMDKPCGVFVLRGLGVSKSFEGDDIRTRDGQYYVIVSRGEEMHKALCRFLDTNQRQDINFGITEIVGELREIEAKAVAELIRNVDATLSEKLKAGLKVIFDVRGEYDRTYIEAVEKLTDDERRRLHDHTSETRWLLKAAMTLAVRPKPDDFRDGIAVQVLSYDKLAETAARLQQEETENAAKATQERVDALTAMTTKEIALKYFVERIHVDEEGYFSKCPESCDDCIWVEVWSKDTPADVRAAAPAYTVHGKDKSYTYKQVTDDTLAMFIDKHSDLLENTRKHQLHTLTTNRRQHRQDEKAQ